MINNVLSDLINVTVIAYIDDILIFTKGLREQYAKDIAAILERLSTTTFKTTPEKYEFFKKEVSFLGFIIGTDGIKIDPKKTTSIKEQLVPKNVKDV